MRDELKLRKRSLGLLTIAVMIAAVFLTGCNSSDIGDNPTGIRDDDGGEVTSDRTSSTAGTSIPSIPSDSSGPDMSEHGDDRIKIVAVGDIMLGRYVGRNIEAAGKGYEYAFQNVSAFLSIGDIVFGNLESPITDSDISLDPKRKIVLKAAPEAADALVSASFNLISLANNHMMDYYARGLADTIAILNGAGIVHAGAGSDIAEASSLTVMEKNGLKIGLLAFTDMAMYTFAGNPPLRHAADEGKAGVAPTDPELMFRCIAEAEDKVDILIVSLHWGIEESFSIDPVQIETAHRMIDAGVDLILGHHPHQCQGMEIYNGKFIAYSLGNFIFDNNDPENKETFIVEIDFVGDSTISVSAFPVCTENKLRVIPQTGEDAMNNLLRQQKLCKALGTDASIIGQRLVFEPAMFMGGSD